MMTVAVRFQLVHQRRVRHQGPVQRSHHARHRAFFVPGRDDHADPGALAPFQLEQPPQRPFLPVRGAPPVPGLGAVVHDRQATR